MTTIPQLHVIDEPARPRTATAAYRFPPAKPVTVPPAHLCEREDLLDLAAGAVRHRDQLWALLGSSEHVVAICRLLVEHVEPELVDSVLRANRLALDLHLANQQIAALQARNEAQRDAARVLVAQRDRANLAAGATSAENSWLRRELTAALCSRRIEASFERLTLTVTGESYAVVAERLTASVRDVDSRFEYIDVADSGETTDGIDQSAPAPADETPLEEQKDIHSEPTETGPAAVDPDETLDMEPEDVGGEGGGA